MTDNNSRYILVAGTPYTLESAEGTLTAIEALQEVGKSHADIMQDGEPEGSKVLLPFDSKAIALASHLGTSPLDIDMVRHSDDTYESSENSGEYRVLTDSEADQAFNAAVESYVGECVLDQLPEQYRMYFDTDAFERDCRLSDGRGPMLSSYDSEEHEECIDGVWYYIYRTN